MLLSLRRIAAKGRAALTAAQAALSGSNSGSPSSTADGSAEALPNAEAVPAAGSHLSGSGGQEKGRCPTPTVMLVANCCPISLIFGQAGTEEAIELPSEASVPYCWHSPPGLGLATQRKLRIRGMPQPDGSQPQQSKQGSSEKGPSFGVSPSAAAASKQEKDPWSKPFEAMAFCTSIVAMEVHSGTHVLVSISVKQVLLCSKPYAAALNHIRAS